MGIAKLNKPKWELLGFTLIEVALILVVVGLLVTSGLSFYKVIAKVNRNNELKQQLKSCGDSVTGFFVIQNQIPVGQSNYKLPNGLCMDKTSEFNYIRYIPYTQSPGNLCSSQPPPSNQLLKLKICNDINCSSFSEIKDVVFILVSPGVNDNLQFRIDTASKEVFMYRPEVKYDGFSSDINRVEEFDDIYLYETINTLRLKCGQ